MIVKTDGWFAALLTSVFTQETRKVLNFIKSFPAVWRMVAGARESLNIKIPSVSAIPNLELLFILGPSE